MVRSILIRNWGLEFNCAISYLCDLEQCSIPGLSGTQVQTRETEGGLMEGPRPGDGEGGARLGQVTGDYQEATTLRGRLYGRPALGFSGREVVVPCLRSTQQRRRREIP